MKITIPDYKAKPKQRPRLIAKNKVRSPSKQAEQSLAWLILANAPDRTMIIDKTYVHCTIYSKTVLRGDFDNYLKFVCDALQKANLVKNDRLIKDGRCTLHEYSNKDELVIEILPLDQMLTKKERVLKLLKEQPNISTRKAAKIVGCANSFVHKVKRSLGEHLTANVDK